MMMVMTLLVFSVLTSAESESELPAVSASLSKVSEESESSQADDNDTNDPRHRSDHQLLACARGRLV